MMTMEIFFKRVSPFYIIYGFYDASVKSHSYATASRSIITQLLLLIPISFYVLYLQIMYNAPFVGKIS
jgi:hypothetical protein